MAQATHRITDVDKAHARVNVTEAFRLAGLVTDSRSPVCPACGTDKHAKVKLFTDGWHCYRCGAGGDAINVLTHRGWAFVDAVNALCGRDTDTPAVSTGFAPVVADSFTAVVDPVVYAIVLRRGSVDAACDYYTTFGISPHAVREAGAVVIEDAVALDKQLRAVFGIDRLVACGLAVPGTGSRPARLLVSDRYPVVEPHRLPDGTTVGLQLRASHAQSARIAAHKAGDGDYVPKFLGLRGAGVAHLVGCGLPRLAGLRDGTTVRIVEGFKDLLAARTLGWEAYALPGAGTTPPPVALEQLRRFRVQLCLDNDDAGTAGAERLRAVLATEGIPTTTVRLPAGRDVADLLGR